MRQQCREMDLKTLAHDLRSPIMALRFITESLNLEGHQQKQVIDQCLNTLEGMVSQVHSYGEKNILPSSSRPVALMKNLRPRFEVLAQNAQIYTHYWLPETLASLETSISSLDLERVLFNLFHNALEASHQGTTISLSAIKREKNLELIVDDQGSGIPEELIDQVLEPHSSFNRPKGSGLGLYQARQAIEQAGGELFIVSQQDCGTRVHLYLPIIEQGEAKKCA